MAAWLPTLTSLRCKLSSLLTVVAIIALPAMAETSELTNWDKRFLYDKLGMGPTALSMLGLTAEESRCMHFLINRFGPEEKLVNDVARFLNNVASNRIAGEKAPTKCPF
jgi:hypothetical protein